MLKNYNLGLKLWSINTDFYYEEAKKLYNQSYFDYIELYVVPDTLPTLEQWKQLSIPFMLHAPHFAHNVNLADKDKFEYNKSIYAQVEIFRQELNASHTIVHSGMNGTAEETIRQLLIIKPQNFIIENKPAHPPHFETRICRGHTINEIAQIMHATQCDFCLDIGHALCTANYYDYAPYEFLAQFNTLNPVMYHISDGNSASPHDQHLNIGFGNYDFIKIFEIINTKKAISIETNKKSQYHLNDFKDDVMKIRTSIE